VVANSHRVQFAVVTSNNGTVTVSEEVHLTVPRAHLSNHSSGEGILMLSRRVHLTPRRCRQFHQRTRRGGSSWDTNGEGDVVDVRASVHEGPVASAGWGGGSPVPGKGRPLMSGAPSLVDRPHGLGRRLHELRAGTRARATATGLPPLREHAVRIVEVGAPQGRDCVVAIVLVVALGSGSAGSDRSGDRVARPRDDSLLTLHLSLSYVPSHGG
jgi:hypothetical protein